MDFGDFSPSHAEPAQPDEQKHDRRKLPYIKPSFRFEQVFVTAALACGKIDDTQKHCFFNRKAS